MITFYVGFMLVFSYFTVVVFFFQKSNCFWYGFVLQLFLFYYFFLRLFNNLQKNKLSSFELG